MEFVINNEYYNDKLLWYDIPEHERSHCACARAGVNLLANSIQYINAESRVRVELTREWVIYIAHKDFFCFFFLNLEM